MLAEITTFDPSLSENDRVRRDAVSVPSLVRWRVGSIDGGWVTVSATDWLSALGAALYRLGLSDELQRMACEVLPNGQVIANDINGHRRFTVQKLVASFALATRTELVDLPSELLIPLDDEEDIATVVLPFAV